MKVLLVNPPAYEHKDYIREGRCMQTKSSWASLWMPLSLSYISAFLRKEGNEILLKDCIAEKTDQNGIEKTAKEFHPELIIVNTAFPSIKGDMASAKGLKDAVPGSKVLVFGMYPTIYEAKCLEEFPAIDFGVVNEPEWVIRDLVSALNKKEPLNNIKGLVRRENGSVVMNEPQDVSKNDLNDLPFPARDLLKNDSYILPTNLSKFTLLSIGRGCPYSCIYCVANVYYGKKFRKRDVSSIVDEIEECVNKHDIKSFLFWGESFTLDPKYGEEICDEILRRGVRIEWSTTSRVDSLNERLLEKMKRSGCELLGLGIESVNQDVLDTIKKNIDVDKIKKAIAMVKKAGIKSMGHMIFGLPHDDKASALRTIDFAVKSDLDYAQFYCAIPYPKSELGDMAVKNGWVETKDRSEFDLTKSIMRNDHLTSGEIKKLRDRAYRKFYFRPKMFFTAMGEVKGLKAMLSSLNFVNWIKAPKK